MSSSKLKKIVITPEEVANTPSRRGAIRSKTPQAQVLEVAEAGEGVTLIQVNELGEVAAVDGSILGPEIAIQITDEVTPANVVENEMIKLWTLQKMILLKKVKILSFNLLKITSENYWKICMKI